MYETSEKPDVCVNCDSDRIVTFTEGLVWGCEDCRQTYRHPIAYPDNDIDSPEDI